jgi:hypothetical protein
MEREYGVVLSSRSGRACVRVTANGTNEARQAVQAKVPAYRIGRFGGQVYTGVHVSQFFDFTEAYRETFLSLDEAVERIATDGFIDQR